MPLVRIDLIRGKSRDYRRALTLGVHQALVDVVGIPSDDRFHVVSEHDPDNFFYDPQYLGIHRTDDVVFIQIVLRRGRSPDVRLRLHEQIVANLTRDPGLRPEDILIVLVETDPVDWSVGNGQAQLLASLPPQLPVGPVDR